MSADSMIYAGALVACVIAELAGLIVLIFKRSFSMAVIPATLFPLILVAMTILMPGASVFRATACMGMIGLYWTLRVVGHHDFVQRVMRNLGWSVAIVVILEAVIFRARPAFLANPNMTASWLLLCWPWMPTPVVMVAVLCTQSRAAIAGLVIALAARWMASHKVSLRLRMVALGGLALLVPWAAWLRWSTVADRIGTWLLAVHLFLQRPWLGWGPGASLLFGHDHMDSAPLTVAAEMGLVGLIAFTALVVSIGVAAWRSPSPARWVLLALAVQNMADDTWLFPVAALLMACNLAFLSDKPAPVKESIPVISLADWVGQKLGQLKRL